MAFEDLKSNDRLQGVIYEASPEWLRQAADEVDCDPTTCVKAWYESDTNAGGCHGADQGDYCGGSVATWLRDIADALEKGVANDAG